MNPVLLRGLKLLGVLVLSTRFVALSLSEEPLRPRWVARPTGTGASLRGLSALGSELAWASGSGNTCLRTLDGGSSWNRCSSPGAKDLDFRDIEAFDGSSAFLLSAGPGEKSRIYKTDDGGKSWDLQFQNEHPDGFLNGFAFWDPDRGIAVGDPIEGHLFVLVTSDGGESWSRIRSLPEVAEGEYGFAASGTNVAVAGSAFAWIGTGGAQARVFRTIDSGRTWRVAASPIRSGSLSSGIFSIAFRDTTSGLAIGGDYANPDLAGENLAVTSDGGGTWTSPSTSQLPYRSSVTWVGYRGRTILVATGPGGSDYSLDDGQTWISLGSPGFHTLSAAGSGVVWASGSDGRTARLHFED